MTHPTDTNLPVLRDSTLKSCSFKYSSIPISTVIAFLSKVITPFVFGVTLQNQGAESREDFICPGSHRISQGFTTLMQGTILQGVYPYIFCRVTVLVGFWCAVFPPHSTTLFHNYFLLFLLLKLSPGHENS
ncbi:hypothetical protein MTBMA_p00040 (plasmid) [Methanothermobacter marburgensis str. Marburg]|uniref:Uncharacterized protein n=1 Tax=Methanothermobacter marburgensis (strain ATCC BAA-927 / DSM 2133 / JCM 14651 / NBRC 100331 / OCM 82 / Marburg) TaxID=79929 RepID=D9PYX5_METTM|nr:hypothetical protein MTBMA_p00040 [Methanothermobacter marburgensis str. Marburg]